MLSGSLTVIDLIGIAVTFVGVLLALAIAGLASIHRRSWEWHTMRHQERKGTLAAYSHEVELTSSAISKFGFTPGGLFEAWANERGLVLILLDSDYQTLIPARQVKRLRKQGRVMYMPPPFCEDQISFFFSHKDDAILFKLKFG
jgi:hypothetical protein